MGNVSDQIQEMVAPTIERILRHPFIVELTAGTLAPDAFARYISQNYLYLGGYARALAVIASRSSDPEMVAFFAERAAYTVDSEQEFAVELMRSSGLDPELLRSTTPSPTCLGYSSFIKQAAALEPLPVALAAMLPCYIVYNEVSKRLVERGSPDPRYQRWIEMYVGETFAAGVAGARSALDSAAEGSSESEIARMIDHATTAGRYEWMFWEAAHRNLDWPEPG